LNTKITLLIFLFVSYLSINAQNNQPDINTNYEKPRSAFIGLSTGISSSNLRDFASSPLIYKGHPLYFAGSFMRVNENRETEIRISTLFGNYNISVGHENTSSKVNVYNFYYSRLYKFNKLGNDKWHIKIGGLYQLTYDYRINEALQNLSHGSEFFSNVMASAKFEFDASRKTNKEKNFLFIKYKTEPRKRNLSFRLNIGLINSTYRNAYAYLGQSGILNEFKLFDNYEFKLFSGIRMSTELNYTIYLKNKNAIQLSYIWDAYKTGGDNDKYEMAHHIFRLTFLFNANNK